ncbi:MAG: glycosyltransferase family protein [Sandaracinaceae bacterium]
MGRIVYSVSGEGRGHAARARALAEALAGRHEVRIYAYGQSYELLAPVYLGHDRVEVQKIAGMEFQYGKSKRLDYVNSFLKNVPYLLSVSDRVALLEAEIVRFGTDLVISDFEPLLPRAAYNTEIPFITLDHQSFLVSCDLSALPAKLRGFAAFMSPFVHAFYPAERVLGLVSSFFRAPLRADVHDVRQIGVLLRPEVRNARPTTGEHLLAYLRRDASDELVDALVALGVPVRLYGLGERPRRGNVEFRPVSAVRFVEDLASAVGLVCTAGNQLIGEAIHLRKPVLAMPERGNYEQEINAHFMRETGAGMTVDAGRLGVADLRTFLRSLDAIAARQRKLRADGTAQAVAWVEGLIQQPVDHFDPVPTSPPVDGLGAGSVAPSFDS